MRGFLTVGLSVTALIVPLAAKASDPKPLVDALFSHMAVAYACRTELGGLAQYQAAKSIARGTLEQLVGHHDAVMMVAKMDEKFRSDPRVAHPHLDRQACIEQVNDGLEKIDLERERLRD
jgi:hypothetical protein